VLRLSKKDAYARVVRRRDFLRGQGQE
jgi:hypothetical protein